MEITSEQLLHLRKERGLTREQLALELDCSAGAIVQWEGKKRSIPSWVADKMFAKFPLNFTVQELDEMFQLCQSLKCTMPQLLERSVRQIIHGKPDGTQPRTKNEEQGNSPSKVISIYEASRPKKTNLKVASPGVSYESAAEEHGKDDAYEGQ
jgi:transcriptional regulator with XRE-family HTH domain